MHTQYGHARICENGHVITAAIQVEPEAHSVRRCPECGAKVLNGCGGEGGCGTVIQGARIRYPDEGEPVFVSDYNPPRHCPKCGRPYEWATRAQATAESPTFGFSAGRQH